MCTFSASRGTHVPHSAGGTCALCEPGKYKPLAGPEACVDCPTNSQASSLYLLLLVQKYKYGRIWRRVGGGVSRRALRVYVTRGASHFTCSPSWYKSTKTDVEHMSQAAAYVGSSACVCNAGAYGVGGGGGGGGDGLQLLRDRDQRLHVDES